MAVSDPPNTEENRQGQVRFSFQKRSPLVHSRGMGMVRDSVTRKTLEPIPSMEAAQQAADRIRHAIIDGNYQPGKRLVERELTEQLNVSRHPVREALRLLAREGFVVLHRNRGAEVSSVDPSAVTEVYAIRGALGRLALERLLASDDAMAPADLKRLKSLMDTAMRHAKSRNHDGAVKADLEFQETIVEASGLARVTKYFCELTEDVRRFDRLLAIVYTEQEKYVDKYIRSLYFAIEKGDLAEAQAIWQGKLEKAVARFLSALAGSELDGARRLVPQAATI
jgi:DNA-binding GntR family transcriptional regulator